MGDAANQTGVGGGEPGVEAEAEGSSPTTESPTTETEGPSPTTETEGPSPTTGSPSPSPTTESPRPSPTTESPSPSPTTESPSPSPTTETESPSPTTETESPSPTTESPSPSPTTETETERPSPSPTTETEGPSPAEGPASEAEEDAEAAIVGPRTESGTWRAVDPVEPAPLEGKPQPISGEWALPPPESPNPLVRWFKRQPLFALMLVGLALGTPFVFNHFWLGYQRASLLGGLAQWELRLAEKGLPLPYYQGEAPPAPVGLPQEEARYEKVGLLSQFRGVRGWSGLLAGDPLPAATKEPGPLESAMLACRALRDAAEGNRKALPRARSLLEAAPEPYRPSLEVAHDYLSGQIRRAATQARSLLDSANLPPACRPGLEAILREANRVRLARLLDQRPVTRRALEELKQWAGHGLLDALRADEDLAEFLALGEGDLRRAHAMLDLLDAEHVGYLYKLPQLDGQAPRTPLDTLGRPLEAIAAQHLLSPTLGQEDWELLQRLILRFPRHGLRVPLEGLANWRDQLQAAVDQPEKLLALTLRQCEVGYLPVGFEDILRSHYLARKGPVPADPETPGEWLAVCLLESLEQPLVYERVHDAWRGLQRALDEVVLRAPGDKDDRPPGPEPGRDAPDPHEASPPWTRSSGASARWALSCWRGPPRRSPPRTCSCPWSKPESWATSPSPPCWRWRCA